MKILQNNYHLLKINIIFFIIFTKKIKMKITINKEKYYINPCPKISREVWNMFYANLYTSFNKRNANIKHIHNIDIRINQAYAGCSNIHFYITFNKGLSDQLEYHMVILENTKFSTHRKYDRRYEWMVDFSNIGRISFDIDKHTNRYKNWINLRNLKSKTKKSVSILINEYKQYIKLKEKFEYQY